MTEQEKYKEGQKKCGIEVGDTARVTRKAASHEDGWGTVWAREMDGWVGKEFTVRQTSYAHISLENTAGDWWNFPYFVLEIVKKANGSVPGKATDNTNRKESNMNLYELVAILTKTDADGKKTNSVLLRDRTVFADTPEEAVDLFREQNGVDLTTARKDGKVRVECSPFRSE